MDAVPYRIREEDVDEVLNAYYGAGSAEFPEDAREEARRHVMRHVLEINEVVRAAPEDDLGRDAPAAARASDIATGPGEAGSARRELALAAIEDLLITDGFIEVGASEPRVFPALTRDEER
jgi:hypothetical protein